MALLEDDSGMEVTLLTNWFCTQRLLFHWSTFPSIKAPLIKLCYFLHFLSVACQQQDHQPGPASQRCLQENMVSRGRGGLIFFLHRPPPPHPSKKTIINTGKSHPFVELYLELYLLSVSSMFMYNLCYKTNPFLLSLKFSKTCWVFSCCCCCFCFVCSCWKLKCTKFIFAIFFFRVNQWGSSTEWEVRYCHLLNDPNFTSPYYIKRRDMLPFLRGTSPVKCKTVPL